MTASELRDAIQRAYTECDQEVSAAKLEYADGVRPLAAKRKQRATNARDKRDRKIQALREQFAKDHPRPPVRVKG